MALTATLFISGVEPRFSDLIEVFQQMALQEYRPSKQSGQQKE